VSSVNSETNTETYDVGGVRLPRPFKVRRLGHTGFNVAYFDKTLDFYTRILGFRISDEFDITEDPRFKELLRHVKDGRSALLTYGSDHHAVVLAGRELEFLMPPGAPGITANQITWQVNTLAEVVHGREYVSTHGAELVRGGRELPGSNWSVYFTAPDGHVNELYYGIEQIGWNRRSKPAAMYDLGIDGEVTLPQRRESAEVADAQGRGVDIDAGYQAVPGKNATYDVDGVLLERPFKVTRLGPFRIFVPDVEEMVRYYRDLLGLTVTEEIDFDGMRCVFLRAGSEHHSIALYPLELRERLGFTPHTRTMSLGMQVGTYAQLRDALRFLVDQGCKIIDFPAELHPGIDYTVNVLDPEGHCIQLFYYMEQIGWDGRPRPAGLRPTPASDWPESIAPQSDTFADSPFMGPLD
jgi:catechol 2,3-dioxygenase-like lactoylglutathione lyase family enzyme